MSIPDLTTILIEALSDYVARVSLSDFLFKSFPLPREHFPEISQAGFFLAALALMGTPFIVILDPIIKVLLKLIQCKI
jgi:hypothetical protein